MRPATVTHQGWAEDLRWPKQSESQDLPGSSPALFCWVELVKWGWVAAASLPPGTWEWSDYNWRLLQGTREKWISLNWVQNLAMPETSTILKCFVLGANEFLSCWNKFGLHSLLLTAEGRHSPQLLMWQRGRNIQASVSWSGSSKFQHPLQAAPSWFSGLGCFPHLGENIYFSRWVHFGTDCLGSNLSVPTTTVTLGNLGNALSIPVVLPIKCK